MLTNDGALHKPFSAGFAMEYICDLNKDGFEEIVGKTPEGKIQIWSNSPASATFEAQLNAFGEIAVVPNPSSGVFSLTWDQRKTGQVFFELFDERGAKVMSASFGQFATGEARHSIQIGESLPNGLYLGRLCSESGCSPVFLALQR